MRVLEEFTYLGQVRKLRELAVNILKHYDFNSYELKFVNHGENTTFKLSTKKGNFLVRIHRADYHSLSAIKEELKWLRMIASKTKINVQKPYAAKNGQYVITCKDPLIGKRYIDILSWEDGFIKNKKSLTDFQNIGHLLGELQTVKMRSKDRDYWDVDGLLGKNATFGSIELINEHNPKAYKVLKPIHSELYSEINYYQKKNRDKLALIHADLHFGNMIWNKNGITPIDFDDCGVGIKLYDIAVNFYSSSNFFKRIGKKEAQKMKFSLIDGYAKFQDIRQEDLDILPSLVRARDVLMIMWLYQRLDNPSIRDHLNLELKNKIARIKANKVYSL